MWSIFWASAAGAGFAISVIGLAVVVLVVFTRYDAPLWLEGGEEIDTPKPMMREKDGQK